VTRSLRGPYNFATDGNYPAGASAWSGTPRIVVPSSAALSAGFTPDTAIPAETENYLEQIKSDALCVQSHSALQTWRYCDLVPFAADSNPIVEIAGMLPVLGYTDLSGDRQRSIVALSNVTSPSSRAGVSKSYAGDRWDNFFSFAVTPVFSSPTSISAGAQGVLTILQASPQFQYTTDQGATWTSTNFGAATNIAAHYSAGLGKYFMATASGTVFVSTTPGGFTGGGAALPGASGALAGPVSIADNGSVVVLCGKGNGSGNSTIWVSTTAGASWTAAQTLSGSANVVYNASAGLFVAVDAGGNVYVGGATGATWALASSTATTANNFVFGAGTLASAGPAIVKSVGAATGFGGTAGATGVAYSFDFGLTWNYWMFGGFEALKIRGFNGRIHAYDSRRLWISGPLTAPGREI
jgi:hypothetical protein